jgi:hypothetical protein
MAIEVKRRGKPTASAAAFRNPPPRLGLFPVDITRNPFTMYRPSQMGPNRLARHAKLQVLSFRETSRFIGYRLIAEYDIGHKRKTFASHNRLQNAGNLTKRAPCRARRETEN